MTLDEIERLVQMAARRGLAEMHVTFGAATLSLEMGASPAPDEPVPANTGTRHINAPCIGLLRFAHPGDSGPLATEGLRVEAGTIVALLQVGSCLRPVIATQACIIGRRLGKEGGLVGYGTPVFGYDSP